MKSGKFPVLGMTCASCAAHVGKALERTPGVETAYVNLATAEASVRYDETVCDPVKLKAAVDDEGYELVLQESGSTTQKDNIEALREKEYRLLKRQMILSLCLSVPLMILAMAFMDSRPCAYATWILATLILALCGRRFYAGAWRQARHRSCCGRQYFAGNRALMDELGIAVPEELSDLCGSWQKDACTVVWFADEAGVKAVLAVSDALKDSSAPAVKCLSAMGISCTMLTILSSDLGKIPQAIRLSRLTVRIIRQNLFWAFIYNAIAIPIAAGCCIQSAASCSTLCWGRRRWP